MVFVTERKGIYSFRYVRQKIMQNVPRQFQGGTVINAVPSSAQADVAAQSKI